MTSWGQHQLYCFSEKNTTEGYPVALLRMPLVVSLPVYECVYIYKSSQRAGRVGCASVEWTVLKSLML